MQSSKENMTVRNTEEKPQSLQNLSTRELNEWKRGRMNRTYIVFTSKERKNETEIVMNELGTNVQFFSKTNSFRGEITEQNLDRWIQWINNNHIEAYKEFDNILLGSGNYEIKAVEIENLADLQKILSKLVEKGYTIICAKVQKTRSQTEVEKEGKYQLIFACQENRNLPKDLLIDGILITVEQANKDQFLEQIAFEVIGFHDDMIDETEILAKLIEINCVNTKIVRTIKRNQGNYFTIFKTENEAKTLIDSKTIIVNNQRITLKENRIKPWDFLEYTRRKPEQMIGREPNFITNLAQLQIQQMGNNTKLANELYDMKKEKQDLEKKVLDQNTKLDMLERKLTNLEIKMEKEKMDKTQRLDRVDARINQIEAITNEKYDNIENLLKTIATKLETHQPTMTTQRNEDRRGEEEEVMEDDEPYENQNIQSNETYQINTKSPKKRKTR